MWQKLTHARLPGRDCQGRATPCWVRGERRKGAVERRAPACVAVRSPPVLLAGGSAWGLRTGDKEFRQRVFSH